MPQVTCPNCGRTINLENRKEIDRDLITRAAQRGPTTFTELLHLTKLPRKTLSMRLKELCYEGTLVKNEGLYVLNGAAKLEKNGHLMRGVSRMLTDRKIRAGLMLVAFILSSTVSGYVLASFLVVREPEAIQPLGTFKMQLNVTGVEDLCAWQVLVTYDSEKLVVRDVVAGGFVGADPWNPEQGVFATNTERSLGELLVGGSLIGGGSGKYGDGTLATIIFGYYVEDYVPPQIAYTAETYMMNSQHQKQALTPDILALG